MLPIHRGSIRSAHRGPVIAAAISRFASLFDGLANGYLGDPTFDAIAQRDLREGQHRNPTDRAEWFTTAYFHHPDELPTEVEEAGLDFEALLGIEGPGPARSLGGPGASRAGAPGGTRG